MIKEALANGRLAPGSGPAGGGPAGGGPAGSGPPGSGPPGSDLPGPPARLAALAAARDVTADAMAIASALANPWASVVLSGAVTPGQLEANLTALAVGDVPQLDLAEPAGAYWAGRAARPWQ